ncbi:MAG TPA: sigma-70 family RNA polymerase sigma factor [Verrucomicrobiae bacterium]|nr:sigma-70 family RNA polymerase sigma factor [Verrucomicrobiae bacterium]
MTDASQLLQAYVAENSEEAFRSLVDGHIGLVYSTALRVVCGDAAAAKDVTQMVFTDLARKARGLPADVVLSGWLYRHTTFTASKFVRSEARRRAREQEAATMNARDQTDPSWEQLASLLDGAISSLSARDRDAVVMRYFEKRDFLSLGASLQLSEDAAQKRVSRALERLRRYFRSHSMPVSGATLAAVLSAQSITAVPATLAATVAGNALAQAGAAATPFLISLLMANIKTVAIAAVVIAAATAPLVVQHYSLAALRAENGRLRQQVASPAQPEAGVIVPAEPPDNRELLRLRGEVARLRREQQDMARLDTANRTLRTEPAASSPSPAAPQDSVPAESWADRGFASPMDALQTAHWAIRNANVERFRESIMITDQARQKLHDLIAKMAAKAPPEEARKVLDEVAARGWDAEEGLLLPMIAQNQKHGYKSYRVLTENVTQPDEQQITHRAPNEQRARADPAVPLQAVWRGVETSN